MVVGGETMVTGQGAVGGGGVAGIVVQCSTIVVVVVVNHHHDLKSTPPKFFARPKFYPTGPFFCYILYAYTIHCSHSGTCAPICSGFSLQHRLRSSFLGNAPNVVCYVSSTPNTVAITIPTTKPYQELKSSSDKHPATHPTIPNSISPVCPLDLLSTLDLVFQCCPRDPL
jgi:hypothetical protein